MEIDSSFNQKASLLVYAKVPEWITVEISGFESVSILESEIYRIAKSRGVDVANPFSFLLEGRVDSLAWHVIDWDENDKIHTHKKHKSSGLNGILENETVRIIGFYSKEHKGIFTHHTRDSHMHFRSMNRPLAGHLDELSMSGAINLKLPNNEKAL